MSAKYLEAVPLSGILFVALALSLPTMPMILYVLLAIACLGLCLGVCHAIVRWEHECINAKKKGRAGRRKPRKASRDKRGTPELDTKRPKAKSGQLKCAKVS